MARQVALFRGINVGGHNKVPMAELRETFAALGYDDVSSIIQSGNVCFDSDHDPAAIASSIRAAVAERFAVDVPVALRTAAEFAAALAAHPFPVGEIEPKLHHIMFLADPAPTDAAALIGDHSPDEFAVIGREIHVRYPQGSARSKLAVDLVDRRLSTVATARNLPTCQKIAAVLGAG
jgi:uncharacterized protein (DUF1697 family)